MRAHQGAQGRRDRAGEEAVRPRERLVQGVLEPRLRCMMRARGPGPVATGTLDAVVFPTALARREAVAVMAAGALLDGPEGLAVRGGAGGRTRTILGRPGVEDRAAGGPGRSPCRRAWRRAEASAGPGWVRWQERSVVARGGGPKERWRSRGCRPAARRGVAEAGRRGGRATPGVVIPARCGAVRTAPWTRVRRRGAGAGGLGV